MNNINHLYVHIPFCRSICAYCDFCKLIYQEETVDKYLKELAVELKSYKLTKLKTLYIGGGTPSSLTIKQLTVLFETLAPYISVDTEYTIEVNPESINEEKVLLFKKYGINRVSIGLQAIQKSLLDKLFRFHSFQDVKDLIELLHKEDITNISLDLMYSVPKQTIDNWRESLIEVVKLPIIHLSLYSLTIEEGTYFYKKGYKPLDDEIEASMYELARDILTDNNFTQYEVSNFHKDNHYSKHNLAYWNYVDFVGVGLGASGKLGLLRYTNTTNMDDYLNHKYRDEEIKLTKQDSIFEFLMMNLRKTSGFSLQEFSKQYDESFLEMFESQLETIGDRLIITSDSISVKEEDLAILHDILIEFLD